MLMFVLAGNCWVLVAAAAEAQHSAGVPQEPLGLWESPIVLLWGSAFPAPVALAGCRPWAGGRFGERFELLRQELTATSQGSLQSGQ